MSILFLFFVIFKAFGSVWKRSVDCLGSVASTWESYGRIIRERVRERELSAPISVFLSLNRTGERRRAGTAPLDSLSCLIVG